MKNFIAIILTTLALTMVSCSANEEMFVSGNTAEAMENNHTNHAKEAEAMDSAYVRIGMYNRVADYDMQITSMWAETTFEDVELPAFGQNIVNTEVLPTNARQAAFDQENGKYNPTVPSAEGNDIILHLDVVLNGQNGIGGRIQLHNVTVVIPAEKTVWEEGNTYDYVIGLTPTMLGLNAIQFSASVEDWQNGTTAEVNI